MSRSLSLPLVLLVLVLVLLVGGIVAVASRTGEKPLTRVEKVVTLATLQK